jgi:hypothetical protein
LVEDEAGHRVKAVERDSHGTRRKDVVVEEEGMKMKEVCRKEGEKDTDKQKATSRFA